MAAFLARTGSDVDHPVTRGNHAHVMFDHNDRIAGGNQLLQLILQSIDIGWMQTGGRLVQHIESVAALRSLQLGCEFHALRFTAG